MDVLYFLKAEYEAIKAGIPNLIGGDGVFVEGEALRRFLGHVAMIVRVADELILPELAERARRGIEGLAIAGDQTTLLAKLLASGLRLGRLGDARRRELGAALTKHVEHMEQFVLPKFREEISTQAREDLGLVARDYKGDFLGCETVNDPGPGTDLRRLRQ